MNKSSELKLTNIFYDLREVRRVNNLKLKPIHKLVLYVLESRGYKIYPKKSSIAEDCGCSKATIDKAIKELQLADLIMVKRRFNQSNRYFINKKLFQDEANKIRLEKAVIKSKEEEQDDPDYDPWVEELLENDIDYAFTEGSVLVENRKSSYNKVSKKLWDDLNANAHSI